MRLQKAYLFSAPNICTVTVLKPKVTKYELFWIYYTMAMSLIIIKTAVYSTFYSFIVMFNDVHDVT